MSLRSFSLDRILLLFLTAFSILFSSGCASTDQPSASATQSAMVVTANPHASKAGRDVLAAGGSAMDAAIAIEAVLSLVEPQSSGLAGGAYLLHFDKQTGEVTAYDGRETAPAAISDTQFLQESGESIGFLNAKNSGLSTGVPGVLAMLQLAHKDHGQLDWGEHFNAAIELAENGFSVSPRLAGMIERFGKYIPSTPEQGPTQAYDYFFDDNGAALTAGTVLTNLDYARTLKKLAQSPNDFYTGDIAAAIVAKVQEPPRAGAMQATDLAAYAPLKHSALCTDYKGYTLCGPPPSSSWVAVGQIMGLIEHSHGFSEGGADTPANWALFAEAQRLAYSDRDHYVADNTFVDVPLQGMLSPAYLQSRAALINANSMTQDISHGDPWSYQAPDLKVALGEDATNDMAGTTHFVVVDHNGNVVSMTASVESIFGSTRMVGGMFLNNQLTDFSFKPKDDQGVPIANRIQANKRPRSSMSPTIVFDAQGEFVMATGSPGGNSIIAYTAKTLVGVLDWGLTPQQAIDLPNLVARGEQVRIEKERASSALIQGLRDYGYTVHESAGENSGLSVVVRRNNGTLVGGADPRREGTIEELNP